MTCGRRRTLVDFQSFYTHRNILFDLLPPHMASNYTPSLYGSRHKRVAPGFGHKHTMHIVCLFQLLQDKVPFGDIPVQEVIGPGRLVDCRSYYPEAVST